jgi:L-lactate dehydrogenase complex protein LldG
MSSARNVILDRIRAANGGATTLSMSQQAWAGIPRDYIAGSTKSRVEVLRLFEHRLLDFDATLTHTTRSEVESALAGVLRAAQVQRVGVPVEEINLPHPVGFEFVVDTDLTYEELDRLDAVLTGCTVAVAETGSLVLQSGTTLGRRALTLVPDIHVCVVLAVDIVATVPEAIERLAGNAEAPTTFVSGPSATADIEMTRVKGVHGPRFLHVLVVHEEQSAESSRSSGIGEGNE